MEQGLAASMSQPQPQQPPAAMSEMPSIEQLVALLMEGIPPEELEKMGVPQEMIMEAIGMLEQQMAAQGGQPAQPVQMGGGLAQQMAGM